MIEDHKHYICKYCFDHYTPKRRRVQKYCSNTCRSKAHHAKKSKSKTSLVPESESLLTNNFTPFKANTKVEKISAAGIGNAALGNLAAGSLKSLFTSEENKPATKGDLKLLFEKLDWRYHPVSNLARGTDGSFPYYDLETGLIVYRAIDKSIVTDFSILKD